MTAIALRKSKPAARELLAGIKVIDVDTHISEKQDLWSSRAPAKYRDRLPRVTGEGDKRCWVIGDDIFLAAKSGNSAVLKDGSKLHGAGFMNVEVSGAYEATYDVGKRVALMDEQGIHAQIAYGNVMGFAGHKAMKVDKELRELSVSIFNDAMADMQAESGNRIFPMALMPWWDIDLSIAEAERCLKLGLKGLNFNSDPQDHGLPSLGEPYWDRLWQCCTANGLPINFHIGASDSSASWFPASTWPERNADQKMALGGVMLFISNVRVMGNILLSRFLERHPKLNIVSVESGAGWVPYLLEALEYMSAEGGVEYAVSPTEIFRRQIYACTFFEKLNFVDTLRQVGADNIMFETDFPHPACLYPGGLEYMADAIAEMTEEERFKVFSGNAARVYNIDVG
jgi:uncharacterized protein